MERNEYGGGGESSVGWLDLFRLRIESFQISRWINRWMSGRSYACGFHLPKTAGEEEEGDHLKKVSYYNNWYVAKRESGDEIRGNGMALRRREKGGGKIRRLNQDGIDNPS